MPQPRHFAVLIQVPEMEFLIAVAPPAWHCGVDHHFSGHLLLGTKQRQYLELVNLELSRNPEELSCAFLALPCDKPWYARALRRVVRPGFPGDGVGEPVENGRHISATEGLVDGGNRLYSICHRCT